MSQSPTSLGNGTPLSGEKTILGHPAGLFVLFFTELWERFNFYGMRALLIFYMTKQLGFSDKEGPLTYGAYNGLVYATPLIGGMLADRLIGYRRAIVMGGILMAMGEFGLCLSGFGLLPQNLTTFFMSLALIIAGNGFFKPNISTMVGTLYKQGDPRRDGAFTIFYMGINVGAFLAPLLCGWIGEKYGYHYGFGLAGIGMLIGLACFISFRGLLGDRGLPPAPATGEAAAGSGLTRHLAMYLGIVLFVPLAAYLVSKPHFVEEYAAPLVGGAFLVYILWEAFRSPKAERDGIFVVLILSIFSIAFWAFFEQAGSSLSLFTDRFVNRSVFGTEVPASVFQSVNAIFIVLLAPLFSILWLKLGRAGKEPSSSMKFVLALFQLAIGFVVIMMAARQAEGGQKAALGLLLLMYFFHTTGELCLSPVGLSMVTKMAPARFTGMLMGLWFLCSAFAHIAGGTLASKSSEMGFAKLYQFIAIVAGASGLFLLVLNPLIKKWERERLASHTAAMGGFPVTTESNSGKPKAAQPI